MEGFVYLGELYDIMGRELGITDKKIGYSLNPVKRENQLNRTKSPIGYRILYAYLVEDVILFERAFHNVFQSQRTVGEWFNDDDNTITEIFLRFMEDQGGIRYDIEFERPQSTIDTRLTTLAQNFGGETVLIRRYKAVDYEVILDEQGFLHFKGETFDTPNKLYNNGVVKFATGKRGNSGTNGLSQFVVKESGQRLVEMDF
jgi:hypothetical protein